MDNNDLSGVTEGSTEADNDIYMFMSPNPPHILDRMAKYETDLLTKADPVIRIDLEKRANNPLIQGVPKIQSHLRALKIRMLEIGPTNMVRTKAQASEAVEQIQAYKNFIKNLEEVPTSLCDGFENRENIIYEVQEEQMFLQGLCHKSIVNIKESVNLFGEVLDQVEHTRRTRHIDFVLENDLPLPLEFFDKKITERRHQQAPISYPRGKRVQELIEENRIEHGRQSPKTGNTDNEPTLPWEGTSEEEQPAPHKHNDSALMDIIRAILKEELTPESSPEEALEQLNEMFGTSHVYNDVSLLPKLACLLEQQQLLTTVVTELLQTPAASSSREAGGSGAENLTIYKTPAVNDSRDNFETPQTSIKNVGTLYKPSHPSFKPRSGDLARKVISFLGDSNDTSQSASGKGNNEQKHTIGAFMPKSSPHWNRYVKLPEDHIVHNPTGGSNLILKVCRQIDFDKLLSQHPTSNHFVNFATPQQSANRPPSTLPRTNSTVMTDPSLNFGNAKPWNKTITGYKVSSRPQPPVTSMHKYGQLRRSQTFGSLNEIDGQLAASDTLRMHGLTSSESLNKVDCQNTQCLNQMKHVRNAGQAQPPFAYFSGVGQHPNRVPDNFEHSGSWDQAQTLEWDDGASYIFGEQRPSAMSYDHTMYEQQLMGQQALMNSPQVYAMEQQAFINSSQNYSMSHQSSMTPSQNLSMSHQSFMNTPYGSNFQERSSKYTMPRDGSSAFTPTSAYRPINPSMRIGQRQQNQWNPVFNRPSYHGGPAPVDPAFWNQAPGGHHARVGQQQQNQWNPVFDQPSYHGGPAPVDPAFWNQALGGHQARVGQRQQNQWNQAFVQPSYCSGPAAVNPACWNQTPGGHQGRVSHQQTHDICTLDNVLIKRQCTELHNSNRTIQRHVKFLQHLDKTNCQELTDALAAMKHLTKDLQVHDKITTNFLRSVLDLDASHDTHNEDTLQNFWNVIEIAEELSASLHDEIDNAYELIKSESITLTQMSSSDSRELVYDTFSGEISLSGKHVYEFISCLEQNFKILKTAQNLKARIARKQLRGSAVQCVPDNITDFETVKSLLYSRFGDIHQILKTIMMIHSKVGQIPTANCERPNWAKIERTSKSHLTLLRKADQLRGNHPKAEQTVANNDTRNFQLVELLPHNHCTELKKVSVLYTSRELYDMITSKLEEILQEAITNLPQYKNSGGRNPQDDYADEYDNDMVNLAFGRIRRSEKGDCAPDMCKVCSTLQSIGKGSKYFQDHLLHHYSTGRNTHNHSTSIRIFHNECPNFLRMSVNERKEFLQKNKWCPLCVQPVCPNGTESCKQYHDALRGKNRNKHWSFFCPVSNCQNRIETCIDHTELNRALHDRKSAFFGKYNIDYNVNLFSIETPDMNSIYPANNVGLKEVNQPTNSKRRVKFVDCMEKNSLDKKVLATFHQLDRPLLVENKEELMEKAVKHAGLGARSIFMFSRLKGLTRGLNCLFDSGGGSSLCVENVPGRQVPATFEETAPVKLHGIGSGSKRGQQCTLLLDMQDKTKVAIDCYSVEKILDPLGTVNVGPAHKHIINKCEEDVACNMESKQKIRNSKIYKHIGGSLDILVGIKSIAIFPTLIHSLPCGLSIFEMKLRTHDEQLRFCLGGPWQVLDDLECGGSNVTALMSEIAAGIEDWSGPSLENLIQESKLASNGEQFPMTEQDLDEIDSHLEPGGLGSCNVFLMNSQPPSPCQQISGSGVENPVMGEQHLLGPSQSEVEKLNILNECLTAYTHHVDSCSLRSQDTSMTDYEEAVSLKIKIIHALDMCVDTPCGNDLISHLTQAIQHLETCISKSPILESEMDTIHQPDFFIALTPDATFKSKLHKFNTLLTCKYPVLQQSIEPNERCHITLLAFHLGDNVTHTNILHMVQESVDEWSSCNQDKLTEDDQLAIEFVSTGNIDDKILYLEPTRGAAQLISLNKCLATRFQNEEIWINNEITPHLTLAKSESYSMNNVSMKEELDVLTTAFCSSVQIFSTKDRHADGSYHCFGSISFTRTSQIGETVAFPELYTSESILTDKFFNEDTELQPDVVDLAHSVTPPQRSSCSKEPVQTCSNQMTASSQYVVDNFSKNDNTSAHEKDQRPEGSSLGKLIKELRFVFEDKPNFRCRTCIDCAACKGELRLGACGSKEFKEEFLIKESITFDESRCCFITKLPLLKDPKLEMPDNQIEIKAIYFRMTRLLAREPANRKAVISSFTKLIELGHLRDINSLDPSLQEDMKRRGMRYIPWNRVFKDSISTPCRVVLNASHRVGKGKSLNQICAKGNININMDPLVINFLKDNNLLSLDLSKAYNSIALSPEHYHLQCIFFEPSLDPRKEPLTMVLVSMTYGISSSTRILEYCMFHIAEKEQRDQQFASMLKFFRFVDDMIVTDQDVKKLDALQDSSSKILPRYGFNVKGFLRSGQPPPLNMANGSFVHTLGYLYFPEADLIQINIPDLYFDGGRVRGQVVANTFTGSTIEELRQFVPQKLTLYMCTSKTASIFDPAGLLSAWKLGVKHLLRLTTQSTKRNLEAGVSPELREIWCNKFFEMLQLKKIFFKRCTFPNNISYDRVDVVGFADYGKLGKQRLFYLLKRMPNGKYHTQLIYGKSKLADGRSVPCQELDGLSLAAPDLTKICTVLQQANITVVRRLLVTDSTICCYWIARHPAKLALFHRNRVNNILQHVKKDQVFHVQSRLQPADSGTKRIEGLEVILPGSLHHNGPDMLTKGVDECERLGLLRNVSKVVLDPSNTKLALDGVVDSDMPQNFLNLAVKSDVTACAKPLDHMIMIHNKSFVNKVMERLEFSQYLLNPLDNPWKRSVRIMAIVYYFIHKIISKAVAGGTPTESRWISIHNKVFNSTWESTHLHQTLTLLAISDPFEKEIVKRQQMDSGRKPRGWQSQGKLKTCLMSCFCCQNNDDKVLLPVLETNLSTQIHPFSTVSEAKSMRENSVMYFLRKSSGELKQFYKSSMLKKHTFIRRGVYYSRTRVFYGMEAQKTIGDNLRSDELGLQHSVPCADKFSPTAIALIFHIHLWLSAHKGVDRTMLDAAPLIHVFQGASLCSDIVRSCLTCRRKLKSKIIDHFGPINPVSLSFGSTNKFLMADLSGPFLIRTHAGARALRGNSGKVKVWILHTVCLTSYLNCIVPVEGYDSQSFLDSFHKISCRFGYPSLVFMDCSYAQIKAMVGAELTLHGLQMELFAQTGIDLRLSGASASSHSRQGRIEKAIHSFQRYVESRRVEIENLTPLQLDTLCAQASCFLNCLPLATKHRNGSSISAQLVTPFSFLLGRRSNHRAPAVYPTLPLDRGQMLENMQRATDGMYNFFCEQIPHMILRPSKHKEMDEKLSMGDLVLFPYTESKLGNQYKLGIVSQLEFDGDGVPRIIEVCYTNASEQKLPISPDDPTLPKTKRRFSRRAVHTLIKIYSIDDPNIGDSLAEINRLVSEELKVGKISSRNEPEDHPSISELSLNEEIDPALLQHQMSYKLWKEPTPLQ